MEAQLFDKEIRTTSGTQAAMDLYVATTGDDVNGNGSIGAPYATITRAMQDVPTEIRHPVHVHVAAGAYTAFPESLDYDLLGDSAAISIDGTAAMTDFDAGPYTIDVAGVVQLGASKVRDLTVVGGGLTPNAWNGRFVQMLTGTKAGRLIAVLSNTATVVRTLAGYSAPVAGDTFKIVTPGVSVTVAHGVEIINRDVSQLRPLGMLGMDLSCLSMAHRGGNQVFSGTRLTTGYSNVMANSYVEGMTGELPTGVPVASFCDVAAYVSGWAGVGIFLAPPGAETITLSDSASLGNFALQRSVDMALGSPSVSAIAIRHALATYGIDAYHRLGNVSVFATYLEVPVGQQGVRIKKNGFGQISDIYVQQAQHAVAISPGANADISTLTGVDANVTNALLVGQGARVVVDVPGCTLVGATGAGNAIKWSSGAANSAYPAANNVVTDALGAQVVGY